MPSSTQADPLSVPDFPASSANLAPAVPTHALDSDAQLADLLKRCSPATLEAARRFRATRDFAQLPAIVVGVIERFADREQRPRLAAPDVADLRLIEDLGLDSLTMMEVVMLAEEVLAISIHNEELRSLRTVGEVQRFIAGKLTGVGAATANVSAAA